MSERSDEQVPIDAFLPGGVFMRQPVPVWSIPIIWLESDSKYDDSPAWSTNRAILRYHISFFRALEFIYPHLDFYRADVALVNASLDQMRRPYYIRIVRASRLGNDSCAAFHAAPIKVLFVNPDVELSRLTILNQFSRKPIIICDESHLDTASELSPYVTTPKSISTSIIGSFISRLIQLAPTAEEINGYYSELFAPIMAIQSDPKAFKFNEFRNLPLVVHDAYCVKPTELLINTLRRADMPRSYTPLKGSENIITAVNNCKIAWAERTASRRILAWRGDTSLIPEPIRDHVARFVNDNNTNSYQEIVSAFLSNKVQVERVGLLLYVPCINRKIFAERIKASVSDRALSVCYRAWDRSYSSALPPQEFKSIEEQKIASFLFATIVESINFQISLAALYGLSEVLPVVAVPKLASSIFGLLTSLQGTYADTREGRRTFYAAWEEFGQTMADAVPPEIIQLLETSPTAVRVISDLPIEWLAVRRVPLCIRAKVTRLPQSPGILLYTHYVISQTSTAITLESAKSLLIVNCLDKTDPLRGFPDGFVRNLRRNGIQHIYVSAASKEEYWAILSMYRPQILIHFGHGVHDVQRNLTSLIIGTEKMHLRERVPAYVPDIVLLGSCSTAPVGVKTLFVPATDILGWGCRCVLGTLLPVQADRINGVFSYILDSLWDTLRGKPTGLRTWGDVVWNGLCLAHITDIVNDFNDHLQRRRLAPLSPAVLERIQSAVGTELKTAAQSPETFYKASDRILLEAVEALQPEIKGELETVLFNEIRLPHSMFFTHLGSPDTVFIDPKFPVVAYDGSDRCQADAAAAADQSTPERNASISPLVLGGVSTARSWKWSRAASSWSSTRAKPPKK